MPERNPFMYSSMALMYLAFALFKAKALVFSIDSCSPLANTSAELNKREDRPNRALSSALE